MKDDKIAADGDEFGACVPRQTFTKPQGLLEDFERLPVQQFFWYLGFEAEACSRISGAYP